MPASRGNTTRIVAIVGFAAMLFWPSDTPVSARPVEPLLEVSAAKGPLGVMLTMREGPVHNCEVSVLDAGSVEWNAFLPGPIQRSESVRVNWSEFKDNSQPMPSHIGIARRHVSVSCLDAAKQRRSAGLSF